MKRKHKTGRAYVTAAIVALVAVSSIVVYERDSISSEIASFTPQPGLTFARSATSSPTSIAVPPKPAVVHLKTPKPVKAIYMSECAVGSKNFRESLLKLLDTTELNSIIIDIRDYTGKISFDTDNPIIKDMVSDACGATDMKDFIGLLHDKNIYVIGRITTFQNPYYTKLHPDEAVQKKGGGIWKDRKGLAFVDVGAKPYWDTVVELAKVSYDIGFDELNFDYIRFPSDGDMSAAVYSWDVGKTKQQALEEFFNYLHEHVSPMGVMSADLFGMVTTNYDDLNIGQQLERAFPYFDYIDPMVYPSHYPSGFNGYKDVNKHPYDIVNYALSHAVARAIATTTKIGSLQYIPIASTSPKLYLKPSYPAEKIRPWLQSFDYPVEYTPDMVAAQIKANEDAGLDSYLFWDPSNKYRSLKAVVKQVVNE